LHESIGASIDPEVLEGWDLSIDPVEGEIVAGQFIAGMRDLSLRGKLVVDALDLLEGLSIAHIARVEEGFRKSYP
jgi:hypothetical protein